MSIVKKVGIDGKEVLFKASAAIPRIYRLKFQRDIYKDLRILEKSIGEGDEEHSNLDLFSLEMFENIAYTMAKHADPEIPDDVEEWLDGFNTFSIYQVLPELIRLWGLSLTSPLGATLLRTSAMPEGKLIGLDRNYALEMVCAGDVMVEYDKLIDRQLERAAITSTSGFAKLYTDAGKVLTI